MSTHQNNEKQVQESTRASGTGGSKEGVSLPAVPVMQQQTAGGGNDPAPSGSPGIENNTTEQQTAAINDAGAFSPVQKKSQPANTAQAPARFETPKVNQTGLPDGLKSGIENLSGFSMDDVHVNFNSDKPSQLKAHAYAQGTDIHVGPGQEQHLAHEAWHVVQQKQGRVKPTLQMKSGIPVNDSDELETEADQMGQKSLSSQGFIKDSLRTLNISNPQSQPVQGTFLDAAKKLIDYGKLRDYKSVSELTAKYDSWDKLQDLKVGHTAAEWEEVVKANDSPGAIDAEDEDMMRAIEASNGDGAETAPEERKRGMPPPIMPGFTPEEWAIIYNEDDEEDEGDEDDAEAKDDAEVQAGGSGELPGQVPAEAEEKKITAPAPPSPAPMASALSPAPPTVSSAGAASGGAGLVSPRVARLRRKVKARSGKAQHLGPKRTGPRLGPDERDSKLSPGARRKIMAYHATFDLPPLYDEISRLLQDMSSYSRSNIRMHRAILAFAGVAKIALGAANIVTLGAAGVVTGPLIGLVDLCSANAQASLAGGDSGGARSESGAKSVMAATGARAIGAIHAGPVSMIPFLGGIGAYAGGVDNLATAMEGKKVSKDDAAYAGAWNRDAENIKNMITAKLAILRAVKPPNQHIQNAIRYLSRTLTGITNFQTEVREAVVEGRQNAIEAGEEQAGAGSAGDVGALGAAGAAGTGGAH